MMDTKRQVRFTLGKQSSMEPDRGLDSDDGLEEIDPRVRLMFFASAGDLEGIKKLLDSGTDVNFKDIDNRTALHMAACQGFSDVAELLLEGGAEVDSQDKWGSTPLADAIHYKNNGVAKLLEKHGAKHPMAPMHVNNTHEIPEYEIDAKELDFTNSIDITKGDLKACLKRKGALINSFKICHGYCEGISYLHEIKPEPIIHRDLEPSNILLDDSGHLKVADFGVNELLKGTNAGNHKKLMNYQHTTCEYSLQLLNQKLLFLSFILKREM